jgi:hypothetical protein
MDVALLVTLMLVPAPEILAEKSAERTSFREIVERISSS